jgi:hypothetical protein
MSSSRFLLLAALLVACNGEGKGTTDPVDSEASDTDSQTSDSDLPPAVNWDDGHASGTRIEVHTVDAPDGTGGVLTHLFDSQLGARCTVGLATDGELRCLPEDNLNGTPGVFTDAACTQPVMLVPQACTTRGFARVNGPPIAGCGGGASVRVFRAGSAVPGAQTVYSDQGGGCASVGLASDRPVPAGMALITLTEVPPAEMVGATTPVAHDAPTRVVPSLVLAGDGAQFPVGLWDDRRGGACLPTADAEGVERCLPVEMPVPTPGFSADTCAADVQLAAHDGVCAASDVVFWAAAGSGGEVVARLSERLGAYGGAVYGGPTCAVQQGDPDFDLYEIGDDLPLTEFVTLTLVNAMRGPVSRRWYVDEAETEAAPLPYPRFAPFWLGAPANRACDPRQKTDGSWICLPSIAEPVDPPRAFADDQCTRGVYDPADLPDAPLLYSQTPNPETCSTATMPRQLVQFVAELGTPHTGEVWYRADGECRPVTAGVSCSPALPCPVLEPVDESTMRLTARERP